MSNMAISVEGLGKRYRIGAGPTEPYGSLRESMMRALGAPLRRLRRRGQAATATRDIWALQDISFEVKHGEAVGIIGRNGAGKSTLLKILSRITEPTAGRAVVHGRVGSLLEVGTGFHPELTGRENIYLNGAVMGMSRADIKRRFDEIVEFSGVETYLDTPVKRYSSGMYMRLAFAVAAHLEPEVLVVDEVLAVGDAEFQKKCLGKMGEVASGGRTVLFVSHNLGAIQQLCARAVLLDFGQVVFQGLVATALSTYTQRFRNGQSCLQTHGAQPADRGLTPTACYVTDSTGQPTSSVRYSKPILIALEYRVSMRLRGAQIAIEIWNQEYGCILCTTNLDVPNNELPEHDMGRYRAVYRIPQILRPGEYWLEVAASIPGMQILVEPTTAWDFEVIDDGSPISILSQGRRGAILPVIPWQREVVEE